MKKKTSEIDGRREGGKEGGREGREGRREGRTYLMSVFSCVTRPRRLLATSSLTSSG